MLAMLACGSSGQQAAHPSPDAGEDAAALADASKVADSSPDVAADAPVPGLEAGGGDVGGPPPDTGIRPIDGAIAPDGAGQDTCTKDGDCPSAACAGPACSDSLCLLGADGHHHCQLREHPSLQACPPPNPVQPCCRADADCSARPRGHCVPRSVGRCGGPAFGPGNECRYDECGADADCRAKPGGFCAGGYPRVCAYGPCSGNADCAREPGGLCILAVVGTYCLSSQVFCRYPSDPCKTNADCNRADGGAQQQCAPDPSLQGELCQPVPVPPP
jgi:hypothetical protein